MRNGTRYELAGAQIKIADDLFPSSTPHSQLLDFWYRETSVIPLVSIYNKLTPRLKNQPIPHLVFQSEPEVPQPEHGVLSHTQTW